MAVGTNGEYGPPERGPYRYRNTLGNPWPDPDKIDYTWLEGIPNRPGLLRRALRRIDQAILDALTGRQ